MSSQNATAGNSWAASLMFGLSAIVAVVVILAILCERSWHRHRGQATRMGRSAD
jgi:hypothetical protein